MIVIDRFEGEYAVLETDEGMMNVHRGHLPSSAREGDALSYSNGGFSVLPAQTDLQDAVRDKLRKLLGGDYD
ncbi:MAG: DUF3006 domain-containing protein [Ruminococcus sp.]|nr:DUF3006 domain-containing protein [Ruminococcus sp.]